MYLNITWDKCIKFALKTIGRVLDVFLYKPIGFFECGFKSFDFPFKIFPFLFNKTIHPKGTEL